MFQIMPYYLQSTLGILLYLDVVLTLFIWSLLFLITDIFLFHHGSYDYYWDVYVRFEL